MDGLWVLLLAAFGIASAVMKRLEKSSSSGDRPQSSELKRYLDSVGDVMKEIETAFDDSDEKPAPQKVRRRVARKVEERPAPRERQVEMPKVSAQFEQAVKIPPIQQEKKPRQLNVSQKRMREAVIWSEVLQPPISKRKK
ncbi:hypothetical protein SIL77_09850 [Exiguobacterium profundum]|uniref:hypothetical protein n=1 Tax=Exiguobacterium TaxID=33986 RepID=UPI001BACAB53|nr:MULTISPECIES: hypothetical protein [Exiguobacterium]MDX5981564.1 hypothetical protein [Exiguobacterium profundum]QUP88220.1 hypothetical protein KD909_05680 [Exiguobacterium sp. PFWT01]